jgi:hypothetical protein
MQKRGYAKNKAQAALEFLMAYGWVIMVVLVAIGALSYFGVLSSDKFVPRKCLLEVGIGCTDFKVQEDSVTLVIINGKGEDITISEIAVGECKGINLGTLKNGERKTYTITGCTNAVSEKFNEKINLTYTTETGLEHKNIGSIADKVESGRILIPGAYEWITTTTAEFDEGTYSQTESTSEQGQSVKLSSGSSGTYTSKIFDAGTTAAWTTLSWGEPVPYKEHIAPDGCGDIKGLWYLDESSGTVIDSSTCGKNGNNVGATTDADGKMGTAYDFDGVSNYITMGQRIFSSVPDELTGMAWIYPRATGTIALWQGWGGQFYLGIGTDPQGVALMGVHQTKYNCGNYNGDWHHFKSSQTYPLNNWYHLAGVYDKAANTIKVYVNGESNGYMDSPLNSNECLSDAPTNHPPTIGAATISGGGYGSNYFDGMIDEAVMYDRELSQTEIENIYKQGILNLEVKVRSCDDVNCDGETWSSTFTDAGIQALSVSDNRYFQYQVTFETDDVSETPYLQDVTAGYTLS